MKRFRRAGTKITRTKIRSAMLSDKTMVKMSLDVQTLLTIPFSGTPASEASASIPLSFIDGTGFNVQNFPSSLLNWANFYGAFRVLGSKIRSEFFPITIATTATGSVPITCAVFPASKWIIGTGHASTNVYSQAYVRYRTISAFNQVGPTNHTLSNYMSSKKMFGTRVTQDGDFQQSWTYTGISPNTATTLANPIETADWIVFVQTGDVSVATGSDIKVLVVSRVTYYIQLEDRLEQPQTYGPSV